VDTAFFKTLKLLAKICAILAGLLLVFITLMTVISVIGRDTIGKTIVGDFELSGAAAGAAIALFMPWCQCKRGNIMVDFFTTNASDASKDVMDRLGAIILASMIALMTWRTYLGGLNAWTTQSGTMMLGFPEWVVYSAMVPPLALTALIGLHQAIFGFEPETSESNPELAL
jgi:TRAP-type C4-dicarboxylate transport system permease small subunit